MKIYIKDGKIFFYKYRIVGKDSKNRTVTLYGKDDADKNLIVAKLTGATSTIISPTSIQLEKAAEWESISNKKDFSVNSAEEYVLSANSGNTLASSELRVVSQNNASNRFVFDYNESDDSLDIFFDKE